MRPRRCCPSSLLLVGLAALALALPRVAVEAQSQAEEQQKPSILRRAAQALQTAFSLGSLSLQPQQQQPQQPPTAEEASAPPKLEDPWATQPGLGMVRRLLDGDKLGVVLDMASNPELEQLWGNPRAAFRLLQSYPMLGGIRSVKEVMAKSEEDLTAEDGLSVLRSLRQLAASYVKVTAELADPNKAASLFERYGEMFSTDAAFQDLVARMEAGDRAAANELQQRVADDVWGGQIDLQAFGLDGSYPEQLARSRDMLMQEAPDFFELTHQGDPFIKNFLEKPTSIFQVVQDAVDSVEAAGAGEGGVAAPAAGAMGL